MVSYISDKTIPNFSKQKSQHQFVLSPKFILSLQKISNILMNKTYRHEDKLKAVTSVLASKTSLGTMCHLCRGGESLPAQSSIQEIIDLCRAVLFPGFYGNDDVNIYNLEYFIGINCGRLPETTIREEIPAILEKFDLLHDGKLNNAAAVLFGRNLYDYPQCLLRMARFRGTSKEEFIDNQRQQGNIYALLDAAMSFFFKHLSLSGKIEGLYREEKLSIPYKALRECCINAFCHRAYHRPGGSVGIAIYDDRVEIESSGAFPPDMTLEKLLGGHSSEPPNLIIANVLYKSELLESWGRGISLMIDECRRAGIPDPEFHTDGSSVWVVFRYEMETAGQASDKHPTSTRQAPDKYPTSIVRLIELIGEHTCSLKEMMGMMELKDRENFLGNYLNPSMEAGLVEPLYPDQPKHPKQKYRLTEQGKALLERGE